MAGLPKKYAKMGFKKGWRAYKASKRTGVKRRRTYAKPARRRTYKRSYAKKAKKRSGNMNMNFGGGLGKGIAVGVAAGVVNKFIPINIAGADLIIAGMLMKDKTIQKIGAVTLGRSISGSMTGLLGGGSVGNGGNGLVR